MTPTILAIGGLIYSFLRLSFVISILICNIVLLHRLIKTRFDGRSCLGCHIYTNICFINSVNGFIWVAVVMYSMRDGERSEVFEKMACTFEANCIQFVSCFLLVTLASICIHNVIFCTSGGKKTSRGGDGVVMTVMPWLVTMVLYMSPRILSESGTGTYSGFYRLASMETDNGTFGANLELMMCGEHIIHDRMLIGLQYCLVTAPIAFIVIICGLMLAFRCRKSGSDDEWCKLDVIILPNNSDGDCHCGLNLSLPQYYNNTPFEKKLIHHLGEETTPLSKKQPISDEVTLETTPLSEKQPISDVVTFSGFPTCRLTNQYTCQYDVIKTILGIILLTNLTWQCAIRPLMITHSAQIGNLYFVDVGSSMLIGIQSSYLPLYSLLNV